MPHSDPTAPGNSRAGIVQIAQRIGVSASTVSRALRPETAHLVKADRRKQILDLADALHFMPNVGARIIRHGGSASLTVVVPHDENIFFSEYYGRFLSCILHAAAGRNWDVHISTLRRHPDQNLRQTLQHFSLETSGIIYLGEPFTMEDLEHLRGYRRPLVLTQSSLPPTLDVRDLGVHVIGVDNFSGAKSAASLLRQLGHREIGLVLGPSASRDAYERRRGYLEILQRDGATVRPEWIFEGPFSHDTGRDGFAAIFAGREKPTALCCANDEISFGVIDAARAAGIRCPEDLSLVGFDDGPWALACRPTLTTIRQPLTDLAERAVALVVEASHAPAAARRILHNEMPAALVIRESTRAIPMGAR
ncbi:MAG TPA: LacI family DNA-binding transcriptional regulator [Candidatus Didemnitutus sp.]|jgi:DNA-binding LacI/PurR family transcriptional regulator